MVTGSVKYWRKQLHLIMKNMSEIWNKTFLHRLFVRLLVLCVVFVPVEREFLFAFSDSVFLLSVYINMVTSFYSKCCSYFPVSTTVVSSNTSLIVSVWGTCAMVVIMHQSIPAVLIPPPPPRATAGHSLKLSVLGGGAFATFAILSRPGGWALAYPGAIPRHLTHVFELTWKTLSEKTRPSLKTGLSVTDSKNLWMFLKVRFLNFRYFFIYTCKHMNI